MLHDLGQNGASVDDAERKWEEITTEHLVAERAQLGQAVKAGTMPEAKAKEILEDDYHAVLEAAQLVEAELKFNNAVQCSDSSWSATSCLPHPSALAHQL